MRDWQTGILGMMCWEEILYTLTNMPINRANQLMVSTIEKALQTQEIALGVFLNIEGLLTEPRLKQ